MIKNDKAWIGDLLGGPLMSRESRVIAELLLTDPDEQTWQEQIVGHNILQASSPNTAKRYESTLFRTGQCTDISRGQFYRYPSEPAHREQGVRSV